MKITTKEFLLPNGKKIEIETGKLAKQASGSVLLKMEKTILLATVVGASEANEGVDFMPLTVDFREKYSAAGKFPGGFLKRESRPSEYEILTMRLVDRALRPLFPEDFHAEVQLMIQLLSADENMSDALACFAASAAIAVSNIPFNGPVSEVRIGKVNNQFIINPTYKELENSEIDMVIAGTKDSIVMVEGEMNEISEDEMVEAIQNAHSVIKDMCNFIEDFSIAADRKEKMEYSHEIHNKEVEQEIFDFSYDRCKEVARMGLDKKSDRKKLFDAIKEDYITTLSEEKLLEISKFISPYFSKTIKKAVREVILDDKKRLDGRNPEQIRPIWSEVDFLPSAHGSAIFTRGETQSLCSLTLGGKKDQQQIDGAVEERMQKFTLHYNFPPFSTGEAKPIRGVSRREIGHGNLAQRALSKVIPQDTEINPYTIRLVSDILESNGSSSMASVCAGTLSLMDAGIKITSPVSGIAMGLIVNEDQSKYTVLSDILGDEDHLGDMDFKVTGTSKGITACQMDIKVDGLNYEILQKALYQAKDGRLHILSKMLETISEPNSDYKDHAPRIEKFEIPSDTIGAIIGTGGKVIQEIQATTESTISIEEKEDKKAFVEILCDNKLNMLKAIEIIKNIAYPPKVEIGQTYSSKIKSIKEFGCFVEIVPGTEGLIHISELDNSRVEKVEDLFKLGDKIDFKVVGFDDKKNKFKLSRKVLL